MKLSKYSKIYRAPETSDSVNLFSMKDASVLHVPSSLIEDIEKGNLSREDKEVLAELGFLVPDIEKEKQEMLTFIRDVDALDRSLNYIVVLNLDCNLGCRYCFEGARKGKFYLSDETADQFIDFVKRSLHPGKDAIRITFYGGEPLLSIDRIVGISEKIGSLAEARGVNYGFSLVTNGTLLTEKLVRRLAPLGLRSAKVTLDGPEHVHNMFRPFKSGKGSFDVIVRNIQEVCEAMRVQIGGNYTQGHFREFPRLLDYLASIGLTPDKVPLVKFDPVIKESREFALPDFHDGCGSANEPWLSEAGLFLREEILRRGYRTQKIMPSPCLVERSGSFVVNYDGALYKCPGMIGRQNWRVGHVRGGLTEYHEALGLDEWKNEECLECSYLPLCFGGCKYLLLVRTGSLSGVNCQKEYFDRTLGELVSQDIKYDL
jgi:uncharacterized protein